MDNNKSNWAKYISKWREYFKINSNHTHTHTHIHVYIFCDFPNCNRNVLIKIVCIVLCIFMDWIQCDEFHNNIVLKEYRITITVLNDSLPILKGSFWRRMECQGVEEEEENWMSDRSISKVER